jgi:hypothetical protein
MDWADKAETEILQYFADYVVLQPGRTAEIMRKHAPPQPPKFVDCGWADEAAGQVWHEFKYGEGSLDAASAIMRLCHDAECKHLANRVVLKLQTAEAMLEAYAQNWRYCEQECTCWWCELRAAAEEAKRD